MAHLGNQAHLGNHYLIPKRLENRQFQRRKAGKLGGIKAHHVLINGEDTS